MLNNKVQLFCSPWTTGRIKNEEWSNKGSAGEDYKTIWVISRSNRNRAISSLRKSWTWTSPEYLLRPDPVCIEREPCCGDLMNLFNLIDCGILSGNNNDVPLVVIWCHGSVWTLTFNMDTCNVQVSDTWHSETDMQENKKRTCVEIMNWHTYKQKKATWAMF